MKTIILSAMAGATLVSGIVAATAQTADPVKAYVDAGFAKMDANKDGKVDRPEFDRFMRARLTRQSQKFDAAFAGIDANGDGKITKAEATRTPGLAENFGDVDTNGDGVVDKRELRTAAAQAQMQEAGLN